MKPIMPAAAKIARALELICGPFSMRVVGGRSSALRLRLFEKRMVDSDTSQRTHHGSPNSLVSNANI
jgi:hypothetical protein